MNVYDFDKTIYPGDSATHFWLFCLRRHPAVALSLGKTALPGLRYLAGRSTRGEIKENMYSFLSRLPDPEAEARLFWDSRIDRIFPWYINRRRDDDLVISASPDFLIGEACRRLGIRWIATDMDPATGKLRGPNCYGAEKPLRFAEVYGSAHVEEFYSDSLSDLPMMELADDAYLVKNGAVLRRTVHKEPQTV